MMNKNTVIGILLIAGILIVSLYLNAPTKEEQLKMKRAQDSVAKLEKAKADTIKKDSVAIAAKDTSKTAKDTVAKNQKTTAVKDSVKSDTAEKALYDDTFGMFAGSLKGENKVISIENELAKFRFSSHGGRICYVRLKKYHTFDTLPLVLLDGDSSLFKFIFFANNRQINTAQLYFTPLLSDKRFAGNDSISIKGNDSLQFAMRLYPDSAFNPGSKKYIEMVYTVYGNDYMIKTRLNFVGLNEIMSENLNGIALEWKMKLRKQEMSLKNEQMSSTIYYKYFDDEVDYLSETSNDNKDLTTKVSWIGFKQQFFSSVLIGDNGFSNAKISTVQNDTSKSEVKVCFAQISIPINPDNQSFAMRMYFGPTHYKTLRKYDLGLERQIPLGWSSPYILGWINRFAVIPVFNWLESFGMNYGIIILILTILLKIVLFPIAYKTYMSSAKMRVLKPEIEEINQKIPKEKTMERQQATMALYRKAGVNPMAGCIPMLLQMPILIALYRFFPASIELRQQHFLWATDLSTYDSIYNLGFEIPFYGDHISLFTLLMTVSTIIYTKVNNELMGSQQQMPGMKVMMYLMPVMFLGFFNNFAAGLSYYYFLANMLTFLQMWIIRKTVDEGAIHKKIQEYRKKPDTKKKSGWQKRLEDMAKQKGYNMPKR